MFVCVCQFNTLSNKQQLSVVENALAIGQKAFRCSYEDCDRLYTTFHHLKVRLSSGFSTSLPSRDAYSGSWRFLLHQKMYGGEGQYVFSGYPLGLIFTPHFLEIMVESKVYRSPHVLILWLVISKGMLCVCTFTPTIIFSFVSVEFYGDHGYHTLRLVWLSTVLGNITAFGTVVSVWCY